MENNFSENNFSPTARTNCADEPRIPSLRTPSPSSLRARTCKSQKGFSTQIVRRKGSVARHRHSAVHRVWSTLIKSRTGPVHTQYHGTRLAKSVDTDFTFAVCTDNPLQTTQCICAVVIAHMGYTHLFQEKRSTQESNLQGNCGNRGLWRERMIGDGGTSVVILCTQSTNRR